MLTISELIAYDGGAVLLGALCIIGIIVIGWILFGSKKHDDGDDGGLIIFCSILLVGMVIGVIMCGLVVVYCTIRSETITPCAISNIGDNNCQLVADTSDNVYRVCYEEQLLKLRINVSREVVIYDRFDPFDMDRSLIVKVNGSFCPSGIGMGC
jgi:hypothetical protein